MKYEVQISRLAVFCVLCTTAFSGAFGAASVRSLGGAGTYSGTSSAASGATGTSSISAARAGSMRVMPSVGTAASTSSSSKTAATTGRVATSPRLSIGKYLGSGTSVSGGSSIKNQKPGSVSVSNGSSGSGPTIAGDIEDRVSHLENNMVLQSDLKSAMGGKQDLLGSTEYITIKDDGDVLLEVAKLQNYLETVIGQGEGRVQIGTDDTGIYWQYADDSTTREPLIAWDDLRGAKGEKGDQGEPGVVDPVVLNAAVEAAVATATEGFARMSDLETKLSGYTTAVSVASAIAEATAELATKKELQDAVIDAGNIDLTGYASKEYVDAALGGKANADASYTKDESDAKYLQSVDLESLATKEDLGAYAKTEDIPEVPENLVTTDYLEENNYAKTEDIPEVPENLVTTDYLTENNYVTTETITETLVEQGVINEITKQVNNEITNQIQEGDSVVNNIIVEQMKNVSVTSEQIEAPEEGGAQMLGAVDGTVQWLTIVTEADVKKDN